MNHEKLHSYQELLKLAGEVSKEVTKWPRGTGYLSDQLTRAMSSALLTLAEGNGKRSSPKERRRFFEMSMGSIAEVAACLDLACVFGLLAQCEIESFKSHLRLAYVKIKVLP